MSNYTVSTCSALVDGTIHNVHTPHYDFNDEAIAAGVAFWVRLVRQQLSTESLPGGQ